MHQQQLTGIKTIQASLSRMSVNHSEVITKTNETGRWAQAELQSLPSRVQELVVSEISTTMAKSHAICSTILTEVRESSVKADQTSEEVKVAIQLLLSDPNAS
jgi:hypothetical protein